MPVFSKQFYSDIVPENIELHTPLSVAIQAESPLGRKLIYTIVKGNELEEFTVDFNTGMFASLSSSANTFFLSSKPGFRNNNLICFQPWAIRWHAYMCASILSGKCAKYSCNISNIAHFGGEPKTSWCREDFLFLSVEFSIALDTASERVLWFLVKTVSCSTSSCCSGEQRDLNVPTIWSKFASQSSHLKFQTIISAKYAKNIRPSWSNSPSLCNRNDATLIPMTVVWFLIGFDPQNRCTAPENFSHNLAT